MAANDNTATPIFGLLYRRSTKSGDTAKSWVSMPTWCVCVRHCNIKWKDYFYIHEIWYLKLLDKLKFFIITMFSNPK